MKKNDLLAERLRERIRRAGPITFREWMESSLYDAQDGYYCRRDLTRWGRGGDYRTSPERSPLFAATFACYFATLFAELNSPQNWIIMEAGAGGGLFARVVLETLHREHPHIFAATRYVIDEISLDARARDELQGFADRVEFRTLREFNEPLAAGVVFANELLDALPVHRVGLRGGKLFELCVGVNDAGAFVWLEREPSTPRLIEHFTRLGVELFEGQIAEVNLAAEDWLRRAAKVIERGFIVTVDYGAEAEELFRAPHRREGTLRAFRSHQLIDDSLTHPGEQDLTTTVDWTQIRKAGEAAGLHTVSFTRQDEFLLRAGLLDQLERLSARLPTEAERLSLRLGAREMILPGGMSQSFQVLVQEK